MQGGCGPPRLDYTTDRAGVGGDLGRAALAVSRGPPPPSGAGDGMPRARRGCQAGAAEAAAGPAGLTRPASGDLAAQARVHGHAAATAVVGLAVRVEHVLDVQVHRPGLVAQRLADLRAPPRWLATAHDAAAGPSARPGEAAGRKAAAPAVCAPEPERSGATSVCAGDCAPPRTGLTAPGAGRAGEPGERGHGAAPQGKCAGGAATAAAADVARRGACNAGRAHQAGSDTIIQ